MPGERWTEQDSDLACALIIFEADLCPGCGQPQSESMSPDSDPDNRKGTHRYEAPLPRRCHACEAVALRREAYVTAQHAEALKFSTIRKRR